jgi:Ca2+-transporting ATPase
LQGLSVFGVVAVLYGWAQHHGVDAAAARAMAFIALVAGNLGLIFASLAANASLVTSVRVRNAPLWWVVGVTLLALGVTVYWPPLQRLFGFTALPAETAALSLLAGLTSVLWLELFKRIIGRRRRRRPG